MSSAPNHPAPNVKFIERRVDSIAEKALQSIAEGKPFSVKIVMPQNVDGVHNGLVAKLPNHTVVLDAATSMITISDPNAPAQA